MSSIPWSITLIHFVKASLMLGTIAMIFIVRVYDLQQIRKGSIWRFGVLLLFVVIAVPAYFDFGYYPKFGQFLNPHDFFHYYIGSKYSEEVGYLHMYEAVLTADTEANGGTPRHTGVRRMDTYNMESAASVLTHKEQTRALFAPERWQQLKKDLEVFRGMVTERRWQGILLDKGYNATPIWNMVARGLTHLVPAEKLHLLLALDLLLVASACAAVGWAFGLRSMLMFIVFFCAMYPMAYTHNRGAFLRLDWSTLTVISLCMLKKDRYKSAGMIMAYAGAARIFPMVFAFGMGARGLWSLIQKRTIERRYVQYFAALGVTALVLLGGSILADGGLSRWQEFLTKMKLHDGDLSPMRVGFRYVFIGAYSSGGSWSTFEHAKLTLLENHKLLYWGIQASVLFLTFAFVRRLDDYESVACSYIPAYFLFAPTFYYQAMMMIPLLLFLPKITQVQRAAGAAAWFFLQYVLFLLDIFWDIQLELCFVFSLMLLLMCIYMGSVCIAAYGEGGTPNGPEAGTSVTAHPKRPKMRGAVR